MSSAAASPVAATAPTRVPWAELLESSSTLPCPGRRSDTAVLSTRARLPRAPAAEQSPTRLCYAPAAQETAHLERARATAPAGAGAVPRGDGRDVRQPEPQVPHPPHSRKRSRPAGAQL